MAKTPNINLNITPAADNQKTFASFRAELAGDGADSNMVILDTEIGGIKSRAQNSIIFSPTQPAAQLEGDVWNEELT